jgi:predicted RNA-binding protein (TIGR00451 family)
VKTKLVRIIEKKFFFIVPKRGRQKMNPRKRTEQATKWTIRELRKIANYQFGKGFGEILFPDEIRVVKSPKTNRIKEIYYNDQRLATFRVNDGYFSLGLAGAKRIINSTESPKRRVVVLTEVSPFIEDGRNVFAKHVVTAEAGLRPEEEVAVVNEEDELLAVGRMQLSTQDALAFNKGVAVKVRHGIKKLKE